MWLTHFHTGSQDYPFSISQVEFIQVASISSLVRDEG